MPYQSSATEVSAEEVTLVEAWKADVQLHLGDGSNKSGRFELTPHIIKLRGVVNDTELPRLVVDYEAREVSFDWKLMLDKLFNEETLVEKLLQEAPVTVKAANATLGTGKFSFLDLLEY